MTEQDKYKHMENVLQKINSNFISLPEDESRRNSYILNKILDSIVSGMRRNTLFNSLYQMKYYGGSYYDGLKVGKPEEYDLDFKLVLPSKVNPSVEISNKPGFVHIKVDNVKMRSSSKEKKYDFYTRHRLRQNLDKNNVKLRSSSRNKKHEHIESLLDTNSTFLSSNKVLSWFEKVLNKALQDFKRTDNQPGYIFNVEYNGKTEQIYGTLPKAYPAFTLKLRNDNGIKFDIDLVPCFQFSKEQWPKGCYRKNPCPKRGDFLVVPKNPYVKENENIKYEIYWRLSFQEQERELMTGNEYTTLKAVIRLLKKLRDQNNDKIASYYIKTIFLWEILEREKDKGYWSQSLGIVCMTMLIKYEEILRSYNIPYYWNKKYNLIGHIPKITIENISNRLKNVIGTVNRNLSDPFVIAKYLLQPTEVLTLKSEVTLGKKTLKVLTNQTSDKNLPLKNKDQVVTSAPSKENLKKEVDMLYRQIDELKERIDNLEEK